MLHQASTGGTTDATHGLTVRKDEDIGLCNRRLVHASLGTLNKNFHMSSHSYKRMLHECIVCPLAKHTKVPFTNR